jgi:hypothetical protein
MLLNSSFSITTHNNSKTGEADKYREPQLTISAARASNPSEMDNIQTQITQFFQLIDKRNLLFLVHYLISYY